MSNRLITPAVKVRVLDALGNLVPSFTGSVTIALGSNPGGATLSGTTPVSAAGGVATFFDLSLNKTGTGYTLTASATGFTPVTSTAFDIIPGTATQLAFTVQPSTTVAGATISPAVQVTALDPAGNPVPGFAGSVTIALGNNPGGSTRSEERRVGKECSARWLPELKLDKTGKRYCLPASANDFVMCPECTRVIIRSTATQLAFTVQPSTTVAGAAISPTVQVTALDPAGNLVPGFTGSVTIALGNNPGGSTLGGTKIGRASCRERGYCPVDRDKTGKNNWLTATAT